MKIYLATPYSHPSESARVHRFDIANRVAASLMAQGHVVFSPISHCHTIAIAHDLPTDFTYWRKNCEAFVEWCDEVHVLCIDGWQESTGVRAEVEYAQSLGKRIVHIKK